MAAPLSTVPLFIRPNFEIRHQKKVSMHSSEKIRGNCRGETSEDMMEGLLPKYKNEDWTSDLGYCNSNVQKRNPEGNILLEKQGRKEGGSLSHSQLLQAATASYLNKAIDIRNIAHSVQPIKVGTLKKKKNSLGPTLEVDLIIHGAQDEIQELECQMDEKMGHIYEDGNEDHTTYDDPTSDSRDLCKGNVMLVRMLNNTPMLDGAEAFACGIVNSISSNQPTWNSFGLEVTANNIKTVKSKGSNHLLKSSSDVPHKLLIPSWSLKDSDQVAPYFAHNRNHSMYECFSNDTDGDEGQHSSDGFDIENGLEFSKSKQRYRMKQLRPAGLRLGNVLIIVQIHAKPSELPLPSLSKVICIEQ